MDKIEVVFCIIIPLKKEDEQILRSYLVMKINRRVIRNGLLQKYTKQGGVRTYFFENPMECLGFLLYP